MKARFIGKPRIDFTRGKIYSIRSHVVVTSSNYGLHPVMVPAIMVKDTNSRANCLYPSIESFLENWDVIDEKS